jgi:HEAT repeat protein
VRIAAIVALRRMRHPDVARFLNDPDERVVTEAARAINDDGGIDAARPALARLLEDRRFAAEPLLRRAINANLRLGTHEAMARLTAFASDGSRPAGMRAEAAAGLAASSSPSAFDRVDGAYIR